MDVIQVINTLGVPVGVMLVMGYGIWKMFNWASPRVDKMIDATEATMTKVAKSSEQSAEALDRLVPISETSARMIERLANEHGGTLKKIDEIHENVKDIKRALKDE